MIMRHSLALLRAFCALALTMLPQVAARAEAVDRLEAERAELSARLDALRPLVEQHTKTDAGTRAQWGNWPNWPNWPNYWNDWRNWYNW